MAPASFSDALSPQVFQILLSLSESPRHGYAMIQDIRERTADEVRLTASTLYDALARLVDRGWIENADAPSGEARRGSPAAPIKDDSRRRYYRLTKAGRDAAMAEAARLQRLLDMARDRKLAPLKKR